jgi:FkbM family methyltransferase
MRIVHFTQFGPRASGLYETAKDLILAERKLGIDARMVDMDENNNSRIGSTDGEIITDHPDIAIDADILIRHSAIPSKYQNIGKPIIMCLHGRPESSYRISASGQNMVIQAVANKAKDCRYKAFVTFWPEFVDAWSSLVGDKLHYVPPPVDLHYYNQGKQRPFSGTHKILIADIWRDDVIPLNSIFGAAKYCDKYEPTARVHIVGSPTNGRAFEAIKPIYAGLNKYIGSISGHMKEIRDWYASCDCVVTPHSIATRVIREAMSAGLPVIAGAGCRYTPYKADPNDYELVADMIAQALATNNKAYSQAIADDQFNALNSAAAIIDLCKNVIKKPKTGKKVLLDIGAHLGETVRRFYRERPDADEYEIYCFEPDPDIFKLLFDNVGAIENVHCICAALTANTGSRTLLKGKINQGDGSTLMAGKLTGSLSGTVQVACHDINKWIEQKIGKFDYLIIKMNIEGAEYELLPYLILSGAMSRVDELYVQLHSLKFDTAERIEMDKTEIQWRKNIQKYHTMVFATTKGMASFGDIKNTQAG